MQVKVMVILEDFVMVILADLVMVILAEFVWDSKYFLLFQSIYTTFADFSDYLYT